MALTDEPPTEDRGGNILQKWKKKYAISHKGLYKDNDKLRDSRKLFGPK